MKRIFLSFLLAIVSVPAQAITLTVEPGDHISDSLLTLSQGDTLFLTPGVYMSSAEQPILTAGPSQSGVVITSVADNRAVLDGEDIERSVVSLLGPHLSEVILENLVITGGNATGASAFNGGGISASESKAVVSNCLISGNTALIGGGVGAEGGNLTIQYSIISDNEALVTGGGIDLYACIFNGFLVKFLSNTSSDDGGGLNAYQSTLSLSSSLFTGNYSGDDGGAITVLQGTSNFSFLTIHSNEAFDDGGGMRLHTIDSVSVVSSIITSNQGKGGINVISANTPFISHVCCWDNTFANYQGMEDPTGTNGNISVDPLYADTELNISQISAGQPADSPGLNAGHAPAQSTVIADLSTRTDSVPDTGTADLGYHHLNPDQTGISPEQQDDTFILTITPSPAASAVKLILSPGISAPVTISVYDITGRRIYTTGHLNMEDGRSWIWDPDESFPGGLLLFQASWPDGIASGKVVVVR